MTGTKQKEEMDRDFATPQNNLRMFCLIEKQ